MRAVKHRIEKDWRVIFVLTILDLATALFDLIEGKIHGRFVAKHAQQEKIHSTVGIAINIVRAYRIFPRLTPRNHATIEHLQNAVSENLGNFSGHVLAPLDYAYSGLRSTVAVLPFSSWT